MDHFKELVVVPDRAAFLDRPDLHVGMAVLACVSFIGSYFANDIEGDEISIDKEGHAGWLGQRQALPRAVPQRFWHPAAIR
ncbi:hypothetical protein AAFG07_32095 [Bradyrhizobium sp. B097]|uniref:hypothetical protein n=1 Tax=Bradyrhizobium sp. B097 TaxID=3140244 RepID=UPI003183930C